LVAVDSSAIEPVVRAARSDHQRVQQRPTEHRTGQHRLPVLQRPRLGDGELAKQIHERSGHHQAGWQHDDD
jgi:hypothetical protein